MRSDDSEWMARAIRLARKGKGRTAPNPAVGAVIVKGGKLVGEGWHRKAGAPHAEADALRSCAVSPRGATMHVTLEPCNHHGRTPPCAEAIVRAGIGRVVIGARDPSPKPGRRGAAMLRGAGVEVVTGVLKEECERLIEDFCTHAATGLPLVTLKAAVTLDGKIATRAWDSKWISSDISRRTVHRMRNEAGAVIVGSDTALADDPELTVRHGAARRNPLRVIVDGALRLPLKSKIAATAKDVPTLIATTGRAPVKKIRALERAGAEFFVTPGRGRRVNLRALLEELGRRNVMSALVESGGALAGALLEAGLADRVVFFIAPKIAGGPRCAFPGGGVLKMADAWRLSGVTVEQSGPDVRIDGKIIREG